MLKVIQGCWQRVLPVSLLSLCFAGCALEPGVEREKTRGAADGANEEVASLASPVYCAAHWVLARAASSSCYIDKDNHIVYYTLEVNGADLYHDTNGCFPDYYKMRRLDTIKCTANVSLDSCLGRWSQAPLVRGSSLVGTNYCPGPIVSSLPVYTGELPPFPGACDPATDPACDACQNLCSYTQICVNGVCNEDPYWRER